MQRNSHGSPNIKQQLGFVFWSLFPSLALAAGLVRLQDACHACLDNCSWLSFDCRVCRVPQTGLAVNHTFAYNAKKLHRKGSWRLGRIVVSNRLLGTAHRESSRVKQLLL